jgi:hypothetical protein
MDHLKFTKCWIWIYILNSFMIQNNHNHDNLNNPFYYAFTHLKKYSLPYDRVIYVTYAMKFFLSSH